MPCADRSCLVAKGLPIPAENRPSHRNFSSEAPPSAYFIAYDSATALLDHRDQIRLDNPLVGSQKPQAMDAGGGGNYPVTRIAQRVAQCGHFEGDVRREGNDPKRRVGVQLMEYLIQSDVKPLPSLLQQCDFEQAHRANPDALSAPFGVIKNPALFARQLLGFVEPADHDVGVEEKSRIQEAESSIAP